MFGGGRCFIWGDGWKDFGFGEVEAVWGWKVFVWDCWKDLGFGEVDGRIWKTLAGGRCLGRARRRTGSKGLRLLCWEVGVLKCKWVT